MYRVPEELQKGRPVGDVDEIEEGPPGKLRSTCAEQRLATADRIDQRAADIKDEYGIAQRLRQGGRASRVRRLLAVAALHRDEPPAGESGEREGTEPGEDRSLRGMAAVGDAVESENCSGCGHEHQSRPPQQVALTGERRLETSQHQPGEGGGCPGDGCEKKSDGDFAGGCDAMGNDETAAAGREQRGGERHQGKGEQHGLGWARHPMEGEAERQRGQHQAGEEQLLANEALVPAAVQLVRARTDRHQSAGERGHALCGMQRTGLHAARGR